MTAQLIFEIIGWTCVAIIVAYVVLLLVWIARLERRLDPHHHHPERRP